MNIDPISINYHQTFHYKTLNIHCLNDPPYWQYYGVEYVNANFFKKKTWKEQSCDVHQQFTNQLKIYQCNIFYIDEIIQRIMLFATVFFSINSLSLDVLILLIFMGELEISCRWGENGCFTHVDNVVNNWKNLGGCKDNVFTNLAVYRFWGWYQSIEYSKNSKERHKIKI